MASCWRLLVARRQGIRSCWRLLVARREEFAHVGLFWWPEDTGFAHMLASSGAVQCFLSLRKYFLGSHFARFCPLVLLLGCLAGVILLFCGSRGVARGVRSLPGRLGSAPAFSGSFWGPPGASWGVLGPSWAVSGASWGHLVAVLGRPGGFLGGLGGVLGPSWGVPGRSRGDVGRSRRRLGAAWAHLPRKLKIDDGYTL